MYLLSWVITVNCRRQVELHVCEGYHCHLVERSWTTCMWGLCHLVERSWTTCMWGLSRHLVDRSLTTCMWGLSLPPGKEKLNNSTCMWGLCHLVERSWTTYMWGLSLPPGGEKFHYMYVSAITAIWWREGWTPCTVCEGYHGHQVERSWATCMWGLSRPPGGEKLSYMYVRAITATQWREVELHVCECYYYHLVERSWTTCM